MVKNVMRTKRALLQRVDNHMVTRAKTRNAHECTLFLILFKL